MTKQTRKLTVAGETLRELVPAQLVQVAGGGINPKPTPSTRVSCSGSAHC